MLVPGPSLRYGVGCNFGIGTLQSLQSLRPTDIENKACCSKGLEGKEIMLNKNDGQF